MPFHLIYIELLFKLLLLLVSLSQRSLQKWRFAEMLSCGLLLSFRDYSQNVGSFHAAMAVIVAK